MKTRNIYTLPCHKEDIEKAISDPRAHFAFRKHAIDIALPIGSEILAAYDGKVFRVRQSSNEGGVDEKYKTDPQYKNRVVLEHENGEYSEYSHLQYQSARVEEGEVVHKGKIIGLSGNTGFTTRPHLHFHVLHKVDKEPGWETLEIQWENPPKIQKEDIGDREVAMFEF